MLARLMKGKRTLRSAWTPSLVRRVVRHRLLWASVAALFVIGGVMGVTSGVAAIEAEREQWGETTLVAVVAKDLSPGDVLSGAIEMQHLPVALVPTSAVQVMPATGRAKVELHVGEVLLSSRITGSGARALPPETVALTVGVTTALPLLDQGDLVDLYAVDSANFSSRRVARNAIVLVVDDKSVTVAIDESEIAQATVASLRPVTVVLIG